MIDNSVKTDQKIGELVIGFVTGVGDNGSVMVAFVSNPSDLPLAAKAVVPIGNNDVGRQAVLMFENGNIAAPVVLGLIEGLVRPSIRRMPRLSGTATIEDSIPTAMPDSVVVDAESMQLNAKKEIHLECGKSSITMTRAGKIVIRGDQIVTRSSGSNRIKGLSVEIN